MDDTPPNTYSLANYTTNILPPNYSKEFHAVVVASNNNFIHYHGTMGHEGHTPVAVHAPRSNHGLGGTLDAWFKPTSINNL